MTTQPVVTTEPLRTRRPHFLVYFGIGMLLVLGVVAVWNLVVVPAWQNYQDQLHYGDARISRLDADVGHGGVSTFLAFDLQGQVIVIEIPGGDMGKARQYRTATLMGESAGYRIISLSVAEVNGVKDCLRVHVEGASQDIILYNTGTGFQLTKP